MNTQRFDIIIIGGGVIGAAVLHFLGKRGITRTLLLEQRNHFARGATGSWGSLLRQYGALPFYNLFSPESFRYYREQFSEDTGKDPEFMTTGSLYFVQPKCNQKFYSSVEQLQKHSNAPIEILEASQGRIRFPEFQWFDDEVAVYEPHAGLTCPSSVTEGWIESARRMGAQAQTGRKVVELLTSDHRVQGIRCEDGEIFDCEKIIFAAGPWTRTLLAPLGIELPLIPRPIQVNRFQYQKSYAQQQLPFFLDASERSFGRPMLDGSFLGGYGTDEVAGTSHFRQPLNVQHAAEAKRRLSKRLKWLRTASLIGGVRAVESYTSEAMPFLGYSQHYGNLFIAAGWCCTGFALAPVFAKEIVQQVQSAARPKALEGINLCPQIA